MPLKLVYDLPPDANKIVTDHQLPDDVDGVIQTVLDVKKQQKSTEQELLSTLSSSLPKTPEFKHIVSEVLYWIRPVVYTLSSALCNQPALSEFVYTTLVQQTLSSPFKQQQQPETSSSPTAQRPWWMNLIISSDLSLPSVVPTILSLIIDFFALYLSPAWDPNQTINSLLHRQHQEQLQLLTLINPTTTSTTTSLREQLLNNDNKPLESNIDKIHPITGIILQRQHQQQLELTQTQLATWQQRKSNYWLYIFRPPFLTFVILKPLMWLANKLANVPLLGGFLQFVIALLKIFQHHYFYASGS
jgi:hypothetical protein